ncbi:MAG TPA: SpoIVB peptidase S55 domain-containing protein [Blastocatellia bacterium]|nr:SpoIVB peptidase S55 domain-containing protein [Blastocatellia bacterium]
MRRIFTALCSLAILTAVALASDSPSKSTSNLMPLDQVRPGMKGYGMSVFQGTKPQRFEVEVLGTLDGMPNPKQSIIIARLSGPLVDRTGVFAGMSGSPVYIDGKLVGAVAYAFPFAKEPIAGITPIKFMIDIFEEVQREEQPQSSRASFKTLIGQSAATSLDSIAALPTAQIGARAATNAALVPYVGQTMVPIATPVTFSGISQNVLDGFAGDLRKIGIQPIAGVGGGSSLGPMVRSTEDTLTPGSSVSVQLVRGDFTIDAAGTVTFRDGERIYAFGHPFLSSGSTSWPMAESSVVTVIPNLNNSFKLSAGGDLVGSINQDRSTGVYGQLGDQPRMVPMRVTVHTSRNKTETYNFEIVSDSFLTPLLARITLFSAISTTERQIGSQTLKLTGVLRVNGQPDVVLDNTFSAPNGAAMFAVNTVAQPIAVLLNSGFKALDLRGIDVDVTSIDSRSTGSLNRIWVDKTEVRSGETIEIQAFARNDNGSEFVERIPLVIPADAPIGPLVIMVGDGASFNQVERAQPSADFVPKDLGQLVRAINKLKRNNRLYVKVVRAGTGAIVNNEEMPVLPPSVLATLGSNRTSGGYTPLGVATLTEHDLPPSQFIISGQQSITINVIK